MYPRFGRQEGVLFASGATTRGGRPPRIVGYVRASASDLHCEQQIKALRSVGGDFELYQETSMGGRESKRPAWLDCWGSIESGDLLITTSLDRLGRDLVEVVRTVRDILAKGVDLKVLSPSVDTRMPLGQYAMGVLVAAAEWDQGLAIERTQFGLRNARDRKITGRSPRVSDQQIREAMQRIEAGESMKDITHELRITRQALYKRARALGI